jgi:hypothetical protein
MLYDSQGEQSTGRGAIITGVDTSHSMYVEGPGGVTREAWAKACALALLDQARHAGRDFVGILFPSADKIQVFRFPADRPADVYAVLDFAETFLGGGTSYQTPLTVASDLLEDEFNDAARMRRHRDDHRRRMRRHRGMDAGLERRQAPAGLPGPGHGHRRPARRRNLLGSWRLSAPGGLPHEVVRRSDGDR